jgi:hypothetical protein
MRHIDEGTLRRLQDEPLIVTDVQRRHLSECERCRAQAAQIAATAATVSAATFATPAPAFDAGTALNRLHARIERDHLQPVQTKRAYSGAGRRLKAWVAGPVAALALIGALVFTPAGSLAQTFMTIFQPKQVQAVPVNVGDLRGLPNLRKFGTMHIQRGVQPKSVASASAASQVTGMTVLVPASLPSGVPSTVTYEVAPGTTNTFTFSAAKAAAAAKKAHKTIPPMPATINGSTLQVTTYPMALAVYGSPKGIPTLAVGQTRAPRVSSTGVTVKQLEDYLLSMPGVSPSLAASIRAIGDPTSTLPIPIPMNLAQSQSVTVQGVQGVAVGDSTGMGSVVVWVKDGVMYGAGGTLPESQVIDIANSLH